jgi:hypothetical protein
MTSTRLLPRETRDLDARRSRLRRLISLALLLQQSTASESVLRRKMSSTALDPVSVRAFQAQPCLRGRQHRCFHRPRSAVDQRPKCRKCIISHSSHFPRSLSGISLEALRVIRPVLDGASFCALFHPSPPLHFPASSATLSSAGRRVRRDR